MSRILIALCLTASVLAYSYADIGECYSNCSIHLFDPTCFVSPETETTIPANATCATSMAESDLCLAYYGCVAVDETNTTLSNIVTK